MIKMADKPTSGFQSGEKSNLFRKGCIVAVSRRSWTGKASNSSVELGVDVDVADRIAVATFGTKDLVDPDRCSKVFSAIENRARSTVRKVGVSMGAIGGCFVPYTALASIRATLDELCAEYSEAADQFAVDFPYLRDAWMAEHTGLNLDMYPDPTSIRERFSLRYVTVSLSGVGKFAENAMSGVVLADAQKKLETECNQFVSDYIQTIRGHVVDFCKQVVDRKGSVSQRTLNSIRDKISWFMTMNIFDDADIAEKLASLRVNLIGMDSDLLKSSESARNALVSSLSDISKLAADSDGMILRAQRSITIDD